MLDTLKKSKKRRMIKLWLINFKNTAILDSFQTFGGCVHGCVSKLTLRSSKQTTPPKFNMEPENGAFQKEFPFPGTFWRASMLNFRGVGFVYNLHSNHPGGKSNIQKKIAMDQKPRFSKFRSFRHDRFDQKAVGYEFPMGNPGGSIGILKSSFIIAI